MSALSLTERITAYLVFFGNRCFRSRIIGNTQDSDSCNLGSTPSSGSKIFDTKFYMIDPPSPSW